MLAEPVRYRAEVEAFEPDERETVEELISTFDDILERTSKDYGRAVRSVHAKAHAALEGEMVIDAGLPPELAQGLFARPGRHRVLMRLSTNAGDVLPDAISLPRGVAIKVLDVEGQRLPGAEGSAQDFILIDGKVFTAPTAKKFLANLKLLAKTTDRMEGTKKVVSAALRGVRHVFEAAGSDAPAAVTSLGGAPNAEPLGETYYSVTPFRYGDFIAKFSLRPVAPAMLALKDKVIAVEGRDNAIRDELQGEMRALDARWEFCVQLCRDLDRQPVEDSTVEWDEAVSPFVRVATLHVPSQDSWDADRVSLIDEQTRFSVWTGLLAHRPLGNINRARNETYRHSADFRARMNGCPYREERKAQ